MPTPEETVTLKTRLLEAELAYHRLQTGQMPKVVVDQNGERVEFNAGNSTKLQAYIAELKFALGGVGQRVGPARVLIA